jgi:FkbM family methyltransferase
MFKRHLRRLRALLRSRKLFRNWLSAGVKYYLVKGGLLHDDYIEVVCGDGSKGLIPVRSYAVLAYDYYDGYLMKYDCRNGIATYVNVQVPIEEIRARSSVWFAVKEGWAYDMVNRFWFKNGIRFRYMYRTIPEIFGLGVYASLDVKDKVVIDVGAFVGDSAIYFALKGAKRVIAVEPHPGAFAEMLENIKLNKMENIIIPVNAGLASKSGKVCLEKSFDNSDTLVMYHGLGDCINAISAVTLGELISRFGVDPDNAVLKMDCEGCEYDVILNDYEHIRMFKELVFEYHPYIVNKPLDDLLNMLSRDFRCVKIKGDKNAGIVHCIRK